MANRNAIHGMTMPMGPESYDLCIQQLQHNVEALQAQLKGFDAYSDRSIQELTHGMTVLNEPQSYLVYIQQLQENVETLQAHINGLKPNGDFESEEPDEHGDYVEKLWGNWALIHRNAIGGMTMPMGPESYDLCIQQLQQNVEALQAQLNALAPSAPEIEEEVLEEDIEQISANRAPYISEYTGEATPQTMTRLCADGAIQKYTQRKYNQYAGYDWYLDYSRDRTGHEEYYNWPYYVPYEHGIIDRSYGYLVGYPVLCSGSSKNCLLGDSDVEKNTTSTLIFEGPQFYNSATLWTTVPKLFLKYTYFFNPPYGTNGWEYSNGNIWGTLGYDDIADTHFNVITDPKDGSRVANVYRHSIFYHVPPEEVSAPTFFVEDLSYYMFRWYYHFKITVKSPVITGGTGLHAKAALWTIR